MPGKRNIPAPSVSLARALSLACLMLVSFLLPSVCLADGTDFSYKDGDTIKADAYWSGRVEVAGAVFVPAGVTVTIAPGTTVAFGKSEASVSEGGEGTASEVLIPGSGLKVEGRILAEGRKGEEITFTSAEGRPAPGSWGCIFLDHSKGSVFRYCRFEYSVYTIHAHFSQFEVSRSTITRNEDGSRLGLSKATYDHCDITDNTGKGLNFRQCRNTVTFCNIRGNQDGVFLQEKDFGCRIENNNITGNRGMDVRLGEFHKDGARFYNNWFGTTDVSEIGKKVYDGEDDPEVGMVEVVPARGEIPGAGAAGVTFGAMWRFKTGGYVDCSPAISGGAVYFGSWDKSFYAVNAETGALMWSFKTGDCVDSSPAVADGKVYFGSWDRNLYCLDAKDGRLVWKFQMPPSQQDDHRQASPAVGPSAVYMGGFDGGVYALSPEDGRLLWSAKTGGAIRCGVLAAPPMYLDTKSGASVYEAVVAGSGDGMVYAFDAKTGSPLWSFQAGGPVNASPSEYDGRVYFGSRDGRLYCVGLDTGSKLWNFGAGDMVEYSSPLVLEDIAIAGSCGGVLSAVDKATGKRAWSFNGGGVIYSSPRLAKGYIIYGDNDGNVYALDRDTGRPAARFKAGDAVQGLSVGPDGTVYAGSRDGYLYALTMEE